MVEDDPVHMLGFSMLSSTSLCCSFSSISIASNMEQKTKAAGAAATVTSKHDSTLLRPTLLLCMDAMKQQLLVILWPRKETFFWFSKEKKMQSILGLESKVQIALHWTLVWKQDVHPFFLGHKIRMCISLCQAFDLKSKHMCNQSLGSKSKTYVHHYWINWCYSSVCTLKGFISFSLAWILQFFLALKIFVLKRGKSIWCLQQSICVLTFATFFPSFVMTLSCLVSCHFFLVFQWCSTVSLSSLFCSC